MAKTDHATSREQARANYDRMARWYDLFAGGEARFTRAGLRLLDVRAGEAVLEIGFGTGHALLALARAAGTAGLAAGVELSPGMIAVARAREPKLHDHMVNGDALRLPFGAACFDALLLSFTLELFPEREIPVVLGECRRVLRPGGRLGVVSMARSGSLACRLYGWAHRRWPGVLDCRPIDLVEWLRRARYRLERVERRTMWGLPVEIALARPA